LRQGVKTIWRNPLASKVYNTTATLCKLGSQLIEELEKL